MEDVNKEEVFKYLDDLRETGSTNMFGATPYIVEAFDVDKRTARSLLREWMDTFDERHKEVV